MRVVVESETGARTAFREGGRGEHAVEAPAEFRGAAGGGSRGHGAAGRGATAGREASTGAPGREVEVHGVVAAPAAFAAGGVARGGARGVQWLPDNVP